MLDESKLDETQSKVESSENNEQSKPQSTQWRQNPDQKQTNDNSSDDKERPTNWRQHPNNQEQQQSAPPFQKYFQKSANRQLHQYPMHPMPELSLLGLPPVFAQRNYTPQAHVSNHFQHQIVAPNGHRFMVPQQQQQHRMWNANNANPLNYRAFLEPQSTASPPRFNPFKQAPNMSGFNRHHSPVNPSYRPIETIQDKPKWTPKQQNKPNQPRADSPGNISNVLPTEPNKTMQNKPKWTPKPQQKQTINPNDDVSHNSIASEVQRKKAFQNKPKWKPKSQHNEEPNSNVNKAAGSNPK
ncbi:hypothetical protein KR044_008729 [Drosophila immigrans]|nr:hypothetical protein KR044_008729 [Drosophila immigrans]